MTKHELQRLAEFENTDPDGHDQFNSGRLYENARLKPLIDTLIEDREALSALVREAARLTYDLQASSSSGQACINSLSNRAHDALAASDARLLKLGEGK